jgi:hypothetical protein
VTKTSCQALSTVSTRYVTNNFFRDFHQTILLGIFDPIEYKLDPSEGPQNGVVCISLFLASLPIVEEDRADFDERKKDFCDWLR